jgi:hypothetical protein
MYTVSKLAYRIWVILIANKKLKEILNYNIVAILVQTTT